MIVRRLLAPALTVSLFASNAQSAEPATNAQAERTGISPTLSSSVPSTPTTGLVIEGGVKEQSVTGRIAGEVASGVSVDLSLTGATTDKNTQRSGVLHTLRKAPGGEAALGVTYSSFEFDERYQVALRRLCKLQDEEVAAKSPELAEYV